MNNILNLDDRGQGSVEVLFICLIIFVIFGIFLGIISSASEKTQTGSLAEARMQGEKIAEGINSVYTHGSGYAINITIPPSPNFTAQVNQPANYITIVYQSQSIQIKVIPQSVDTYTITSDPQGQNDIIYTIYNQDGTIHFKKN